VRQAKAEEEAYQLELARQAWAAERREAQELEGG